MILDFKEIPQANKVNGLQDAFELFSRDFLEILGYEILQNPDRGADGKKDLIIRESRIGVSGVTQIKWLVSCKHFAHSGKSVSDIDEPNITDRLKVHDCHGFLGFYSTLPATSLNNNFEGLKKTIEIQSFDRGRIEKFLFESPKGLKLASRYFPVSFKKFSIENPKPAKLFSDDICINCEYCDSNLLSNKKKGIGILVLLQKIKEDEAGNFKLKEYENAYFTCKGNCDLILKSKYFQSSRYVDSWIDISDFLTPVGFLKKQMAWFNGIVNENEKIEGQAFVKLKKLFLSTFPYIAREQTSSEKAKIKKNIQFGWDHFL